MAHFRPRKMSFKRGTPAAAKRSEIAEAIHREHPDMPMARKMRIATTAVKKARGHARRRY